MVFLASLSYKLMTPSSAIPCACLYLAVSIPIITLRHFVCVAGYAVSGKLGMSTATFDASEVPRRVTIRHARVGSSPLDETLTPCGGVGGDSEEQRGEPLIRVALRPSADSNIAIVPFSFQA